VAVLTALSEGDARHLLSAYGLGPLRALEGVAGGSVNSNFRVTHGTPASERPVFLRLYEERDRAGAEREAAMLVDDQEVALTPLLRFQMRGAGYSHPQFGHGRRHPAPLVAGEVLNLDELDPLEFANVHVQHVVRARRGTEVGIGVLEQFVIGPYGPSGLTGLLDGA